MKKNFFTIILTLLVAIICFISPQVFGQKNTDDAIFKAIDDYNLAVQKSDIGKIKLLWIHDSQVFWLSIGKFSFTHSRGWEQIEKRINGLSLQDTEIDSVINIGKPKIIRKGVSFAMVESNPIFFSKDEKIAYQINQNILYILEKKSWKIASRTISFPDSYKNTKENTTTDLLMVGYSFLTKNETEKAIEIFKLTTKYFPHYWNSYDSLAEAYEKVGETKLAVENYEKSLMLNPESKSGTDALKRLKK